MLNRRPRLKVEAVDGEKSASSSSMTIPRAPSSFAPYTSSSHPSGSPKHAHTSVFRSLQLELHINSAYVQVVHDPAKNALRSLPVFSHSDVVSGQVMLDETCSSTGQLIISVQGCYIQPDPEGTSSPPPVIWHGLDQNRANRHVFFHTSTVISVSPIKPEQTPRSPFARVRKGSTTSRKPSISNPSPPDILPGSPRFHSFHFELPQETHGGTRFMPASFAPVKSKGKAPATAAMEIAEESEVEIAYFVTATWEPQDGMENPVSLEAPVLFQPEPDLTSLNSLHVQQNPDSWLEMPLRFDRPLPFTCAVTLPSPALFSRTQFVPYFVVFTTTPRSSTLAREIASDASITVRLIRQVTTTSAGIDGLILHNNNDGNQHHQHDHVPGVVGSGLPTPPLTPPSSLSGGEDTIEALLPERPGSRLQRFRNAVKSSPKLSKTPSLNDIRTAASAMRPRAGSSAAMMQHHMMHKPLPPAPQLSASSLLSSSPPPSALGARPLHHRNHTAVPSLDVLAPHQDGSVHPHGRGHAHHARMPTASSSLSSSSSLLSSSSPPATPPSASRSKTRTETTTLYTDVSIGFPKRPRHRCAPDRSHPTLQEYNSLPDGLYKSKMQLVQGMLPTVDWPGINVRYYIDVSISVGQDELRARVPIRII